MSQRLSSRLVYALLAVLAVYHTGLLGRGAFAFPDEHLYGRSLQAAEALGGGDFSVAAAALSGWGSRPAEYLLRMPAAAVQLALERATGLSPLSPASLPVATAQNVVVSFLLGLTFFRVSSRLLPEGYAGAATYVFVLLTPNHSWIRHVVPYDAALWGHLLALLLATQIQHEEPHPSFERRALIGGGGAGALLFLYPLIFYRARGLGLPFSLALLSVSAWVMKWLRQNEPPDSFRQVARVGLVSGVALAIYPGYYSFVPTVGLFVLLAGRPNRAFCVSRSSVRNSVVFGGAVLVVVSAFEVLARVGGLSYLGGARLLASAIKQGSFEEGFVFLGTWLWATDTLAAAWLLPASIMGAIVLSRISNRDADETTCRLARVTAILSALYLAYAFQSVVMHKMTFSGRYARMYIPVIVWMAALALSRIPRTHLRALSFAAAGVLSLASFWRFAVQYQKVGYPADVLYDLGIAYEDVLPENILHEFDFLSGYALPVRAVTAGSNYVTRTADDRFLLVNFALPSLDGPAKPAVAPPFGGTLLHESLHFASLPVSAWEVYGKEKRDLVIGRQFRLRVYAQPQH